MYLYLEQSKVLPLIENDFRTTKLVCRKIHINGGFLVKISFFHLPKLLVFGSVSSSDTSSYY